METQWAQLVGVMERQEDGYCRLSEIMENIKASIAKRDIDILLKWIKEAEACKEALNMLERQRALACQRLEAYYGTSLSCASDIIAVAPPQIRDVILEKREALLMRVDGIKRDTKSLQYIVRAVSSYVSELMMFYAADTTKSYTKDGQKKVSGRAVYLRQA